MHNMKLHEKIKEFNKLFNSFSDDAKKAYFKNFSLEFTHDSTAIEGNTIGFQEMRVLLDKGIVPGGGKTIAEVNEILGFAKAFDLMMKHVCTDVPVVRLPSTSSANAAMRLDDLVEKYRVIVEETCR